MRSAYQGALPLWCLIMVEVASSLYFSIYCEFLLTAWGEPMRTDSSMPLELDCTGVKSWGIEHDCKCCIWLCFVAECYSGPVRAVGESSEQPVRRPEVCPAPLLHTGRQPTSHFQSPSFFIRTAVKMPDLRMPVCAHCACMNASPGYCVQFRALCVHSSSYTTFFHKTE
jgi:hypothetical protein